VKEADIWYDCCDAPFSRITFTFHLRRKSLYYVINLLLPCCLFSIMSVLTFVLQPSYPERLGLGKQPPQSVASPAIGHWGTCFPSISNNFIFSSLWSKPDIQLSKYCAVCEMTWCRCQQLTALSISTALLTKLLVIEQLLHPALESTVSAP